MQFQDGYADTVAKFLKKKKKDDKLNKFDIDMKLSVIKPLHARWLVKTHKQLAQKTHLIRGAFHAARITVNQ